MSSLALMRFLESAPARYDAGMRLLTLGRVAWLYDALAAAAARPGARVLEIGCGTGAVTRRLVAGGARVTALDQDARMMEMARARIARSGRDDVTWLERAAVEIADLPAACFDAVVASLCLSEMAAAERRLLLRAAADRLRAGGVLAAGDEVVPRRRAARVVHGAARAPQALLGWLLAGSSSRPLRDLPGELRAAGLEITSEQTRLWGRLAVVTARKPEGTASRHPSSNGSRAHR